MKASMLVTAAIFAMVALSGCSLMDGIQEVDRTLDYVNGATAYVNDAAAWAESVPAMAERAVTDPQVRDDLIAELEEMETRIGEFNAMDAPAIAADIHGRLTEYNDKLQEEIGLYMEKLNQEVIDLQSLSEIPLVGTLEEIAQTLTALRELGE